MNPPDSWIPLCEHDEWALTLVENWSQGAEEATPFTEIRLECIYPACGVYGPRIEEHHLTALLRGDYDTKREAIKQLRNAIDVEGRSPEHHHNIMAKHRKEWPTLWKAIDRLLR